MENYFQTYDEKRVRGLLNNIKQFPIKTKKILNEKETIAEPNVKYTIYGNLWDFLFNEPIIYYKKNLTKFLVYINSDYIKNYNILEIKKHFVNIKKEFKIEEEISNKKLKSIAEILFADYYDESLLAINKTTIFNDERDELIEFALNFNLDNPVRDYPQNIFKQLIYFLNDVVSYNEEYKNNLNASNSDENEIYQYLWKMNNNDITNESMNEQIEYFINLKKEIYNNNLIDYSNSNDFNIEAVFKKIIQYKPEVINSINDYYQLKFIYKMELFFKLKSSDTSLNILKLFEADCKKFKRLYDSFKSKIKSSNYFKVGGNDE